MSIEEEIDKPEQPIETQVSLAEVQELRRALIEREFTQAEIQDIREQALDYRNSGHDDTPGYKRFREQEAKAIQLDIEKVQNISEIYDKLSRLGLSVDDLVEYITRNQER